MWGGGAGLLFIYVLFSSLQHSRAAKHCLFLIKSLVQCKKNLINPVISLMLVKKETLML